MPHAPVVAVDWEAVKAHLKLSSCLRIDLKSEPAVTRLRPSCEDIGELYFLALVVDWLDCPHVPEYTTQHIFELSQSQVATWADS